ncbi:MAG: 5'-3' exonuclease [Marmoricola sp.]
MADRSERRLLLDTASLYFRAFFGVPDTLRSPNGEPVNAVRGLLDFIARLVEEYQPTEIVCCWDDNWRPTWRVALIPSYKEHRVVAERPEGDVEEVPDPLQLQIPVIREVLEAIGIAVVGADDHEADDVIGTLATNAGMPVDIVTGDRDLFQLVDDAAGVRVLYAARGVGRHERVTDEVVVTKYGVLPCQYADFATMRGDASDGLPGVAGIGEKTAASLLLKFGTLDAIVEAARDPESAMGPGPRRRILDALPYLAVAPEVVAVKRELTLPAVSLARPQTPADVDALAALDERWGLGSSLERVLGVLQGDYSSAVE